jgi:hypothetical protein
VGTAAGNALATVGGDVSAMGGGGLLAAGNEEERRQEELALHDREPFGVSHS